MFFFHFQGASPSGPSKLCSSWAVTNIYIYIHYILYIYAKRSKIWFLVCHKAWGGFSPSTWKKRNNYISARFLVGMHPLNIWSAQICFFGGKFTTMKISTRESMFTELMSDDVVVSFSSLKFQGFHFQIAMSFWLSLTAWCSPRKVACCIPHSGPNKFLLKDFWDPVASKKDPCVRTRTSNPSKTSMKHHETFPIPSKQHDIYHTWMLWVWTFPPPKKSSTWNWKQKVPDFYTTKTQPFQWQNRGLNPQSAGVPAPRITASSGEVQMLGIQVLTSCHEQQNMYSEPYSHYKVDGTPSLPIGVFKDPLLWYLCHLFWSYKVSRVLYIISTNQQLVGGV